MNLRHCLIPGLLVLALSSVAKADGGLAAAYLYGYGGFGNIGVRSFGPTPPYFAMHPPVYYGQRYTRPYGVSPYAAWPQLQSNSAFRPSVYPQRATIMANPHFGSPAICEVPEVKAGFAARETTVKPLTIDNPYFDQGIVDQKSQYTSR